MRLPPAAVDVAAERALARVADRTEQRCATVATLLADEKVTLAASALLWAYYRFASRDRLARRRADTIALSGLAAAVLPHALKRLVDRERPNRRIFHFGKGIAREGAKWDSFPSGHAMHLGALATAVAEEATPAKATLIWTSATALASTRLLVLAHYPSDVAAGLLIGRVLALLARRVASKAPMPTLSSVRR
jgi:undecaprenyl-diphosphatase